MRTVFRAPALACVTNDAPPPPVRLKRETPSSAGCQPTGGCGEPARLHDPLLRQHLKLGHQAKYVDDYGMPQWLRQLDHLGVAALGRRAFSWAGTSSTISGCGTGTSWRPRSATSFSIPRECVTTVPLTSELAAESESLNAHV